MPIGRSARIAAILALVAMSGSAGGVAQAQDAQGKTMKLFKVVTPKDDIVIGLADEELRSFGPAADLDNLAQHLATVGQMTVWQYAVKKSSDGALLQAPLRRVAIFKTDAMRIEPVNPAPLKVVPPDSAAQ